MRCQITHGARTRQFCNQRLRNPHVRTPILPKKITEAQSGIRRPHLAIDTYKDEKIRIASRKLFGRFEMN